MTKAKLIALLLAAVLLPGLGACTSTEDGRRFDPALAAATIEAAADELAFWEGSGLLEPEGQEKAGEAREALQIAASALRAAPAPGELESTRGKIQAALDLTAALAPYLNKSELLSLAGVRATLQAALILLPAEPNAPDSD